MSHRHEPDDFLTRPSRRTRQQGSLGLRTLLLTVVMLASLAFASPHVTSAAQEGPTASPTLSSATIDPAFGGTIVVVGANFTPGGVVFIEIYDRSGDDVYRTRWATASADTVAVNGSSATALGSHPGGVVHELFVRLCEHPVKVRALDQQSGTWSNLLELDTDCDIT